MTGAGELLEEPQSIVGAEEGRWTLLWLSPLCKTMGESDKFVKWRDCPTVMERASFAWAAPQAAVVKLRDVTTTAIFTDIVPAVIIPSLRRGERETMYNS